MKREIFLQKIRYALSTSAPLAAATTFLSVYCVFVSLFSSWLPHFRSEMPKFAFHICSVIAIFSIPWLCMLRYRWLPSSILIPNDDHSCPYQVTFSTSSIFEQDGPLVLSYNRNNLVGGVMVKGANNDRHPNLMAQFMTRYFADSGDKAPTAFDWELFKARYDSPETYLYCMNPAGKVEVLDKSQYPLLSCYAPHWQKYPETSLPGSGTFDPKRLLPEGTVLALSLPAGSKDGRKYAFLLCNTWYELPNPQNAHPSITSLSSCMQTLWKAAPRDRDIFGENLCIPFLGKGKSGIKFQAYALLWEIVFSWRKSLAENETPSYGLNICIPINEMLSRKIKLKEVIHFLTFALKS